MIKNPRIPKIILFHSKDMKVRGNKSYLVVTDKGGEEHKISDKRQELWGLFNTARDCEPFLLVYETFKDVSYVVDAKPITDEILKVAVRDMGLKLAEGQTEERNRSTALSYAKDMAVAKLIDISELFTQAQKNYRFIKGIAEPSSEPEV